MSDSDPCREKLRSIKSAMLKQYGDCEWFCGVGIIPTDDGLGLRLNVDPEIEVEDGEIPDTYDSIAIEIMPIGGYEARKD